MKRSAALGTAVYIALTSAIFGGAYFGFKQMVGPLTKTASAEPIVQQGPVERTSGKWTPVEIKRQAAPISPPIAPPPYAAVAKKAALAQIAERREYRIKKRLVVARHRLPEAQQAFAFAPEPQRTFGPFGF